MTDLNRSEDDGPDESMVVIWTPRPRAIWPREVELFRRYALADDIRILDAGCGTGEGSSRLAELYHEPGCWGSTSWIRASSWRDAPLRRWLRG